MKVEDVFKCPICGHNKIAIRGILVSSIDKIDDGDGNIGYQEARKSSLSGDGYRCENCGSVLKGVEGAMQLFEYLKKMEENFPDDES